MTQFVIVYYTRDIYASKYLTAAHLTSSILLRILEMTLGVEVIFLLEASSLAIIQNPAPLSSFTTLIILV